MGTHANGERHKSFKGTKEETYSANTTTGPSVNYHQERLMIPVSACVFLGTVLVMLLILYIMKHCKNRRCHSSDDDGDDNDISVNDEDHHRQAQIHYPPPYHLPNRAGLSQMGCTVLRQNFDLYGQRRREIQLLEPPNYLPAAYLNGRQHGQELGPDAGTSNPIFQEDSDQSGSESSFSMENGLEIRDLYKLTDRSVTQTVCRKCYTFSGSHRRCSNSR